MKYGAIGFGVSLLLHGLLVPLLYFLIEVDLKPPAPKEQALPLNLGMFQPEPRPEIPATRPSKQATPGTGGAEEIPKPAPPPIPKPRSAIAKKSPPKSPLTKPSSPAKESRTREPSPAQTTPPTASQSTGPSGKGGAPLGHGEGEPLGGYGEGQAAGGYAGGVPGGGGVPDGVPGQAGDGGSAGADNTLQSYGETLLALVKRHKAYPPIAQSRGWQGTVRVELTLGPGGQVANLRIFQSSGHQVLDEKALEMVRKAVQASRMPRTLRESEFTLRIPINFNLARNR